MSSVAQLVPVLNVRRKEYPYVDSYYHFGVVLGGGGGYYGKSRWSYGGGAGIGLGTILLILLVAYMLGIFH
jgi:hypothetical protein